MLFASNNRYMDYVCKFKEIMDREPYFETDPIKIRNLYITHINEFFFLLVLSFMLIIFVKIVNKMINRSSLVIRILKL